jgi:predicted oxidoreductase
MPFARKCEFRKRQAVSVDPFIQLGQGSLRSAPLAWGMWRFQGDDVAAAQARVEAALAAGVTLLDTADVYGFDAGAFGMAENLLGKVLAAAPHLRERFVLASKGGIMPGIPYDSSSAYLTSALEASLTRMGVERIDLYQIHRPDILTHPSEVAQTLTAMREAGKIGEVGVSNYTIGQVAAIQAYLPFPIAAIQIEVSPLAIEAFSDGRLDQAMERKMAVLAWSPLAQGRLGDGETSDERTLAVRAALDAIAQDKGVSRAVLVYAWLMAHPSRPIPIIGSQQPARIAEAAEALSVKLSRTEWYAVLTAARGEPLP